MMVIKALIKWPVLFLLVLPIQGCFQPVELPEIHRYELYYNPSVCDNIVNAKTSKTLFITLPQANQPYNTTQMVYSQSPNEINYFAQNRWVAPTPQMILPLMLQSMRNTHYFKAVTGFPTVANTNYRLDTTIINFKQEFCGQRNWVHITLDATLIRSDNQKVIATRRINIALPTRCKAPEAAIKAYQCALNSVLRQLKWFIISNTL